MKEKKRLQVNAANIKWQLRNASHMKTYRKKYIQKYYLKNKKSCNNASVEYRRKFPEKDKRYKRNYEQNNRDKINAKRAKRRASRYNATPKWLTKLHLIKIREFYTETKRLEKETGIKYNVDHIIPLQGETVCGLHVPWNLQILTQTENARKSNRLIL